MQKLNIEDQAILLRRIEFEDVNVEGRKLVLFTTILDKNIPKCPFRTKGTRCFAQRVPL